MECRLGVAEFLGAIGALERELMRACMRRRNAAKLRLALCIPKPGRADKLILSRRVLLTYMTDLT
jgi:hypothetical protein